MKIDETTRVANQLKNQFYSSSFEEKVWHASITNDMYIHIESLDGTTVIFSPDSDERRRPTYAYVTEMPKLKNELIKNNGKSVSLILPESKANTNTLAYVSFLDSTSDHEIILYIFTPLYPVASTVEILKDQLIYVTIISLILACMLSAYLSNRIARPIKNITTQARKLAKGQYGITFTGGHYTEIINLANTLTYTSMELEKSTTLQKDLLANVSHDLKTPLTMVKSYAEMIRDLSGDVPTKRNSHLKVIIDEADRLNILVNDMLSLSRMQSGVITLEVTTFDMKELAETIVSSYSLLNELEGYMILLDCPEEIKVVGDPSRIKQVVSNLLNNAIKYCGSDKTVYVSVRKNKGKMRCEITDHGMGISEKELERIWDRYYKASTNHVRATTGSGLGLSIVKEILMLHNSKFGAISKIGSGSTFWFEMKCEN